MYDYYTMNKYCCKNLPMGASNSSDIFQHKMNDLLQGFEFIRAYIYEYFMQEKVYWTDHVHKLELNLNKLK